MILLEDPIGSVACLKLQTDRLGSSGFISGNALIADGIAQGANTVLLDMGRAKTLKASDIAILVELAACAQPRAELALTNVGPALFQQLRDQSIDEVIRLFSSKARALADQKIRAGLMSHVPLMMLVGEKPAGTAPLTSDLPRPLLNIFGKSILTHGLEHAARFGLRRVHMNPGHHGQKLIDAIGGGAARGQLNFFAREGAWRHGRWSDQPASPVGALKKQIREHALLSEPTVLMFGHVVSDVDLYDLYADHVASGADVTVAASPATSQGKAPLQQAGPVLKVLSDVSGRLGELSPLGSVPAAMILSPDAADYVLRATSDEIDAAFLSDLSGMGAHVTVREQSMAVARVETARDYASLWRRAFAGHFPNLRGDATEVQPGLWAHKDSATLDGIDAEGACYIGAGVEVARAASLRGCILLDGNSVIEEGAYIRNSVVFPGSLGRSSLILDGMIASPKWAVSTDYADGSEQPWAPVPELAVMPDPAAQREGDVDVHDDARLKHAG